MNDTWDNDPVAVIVGGGRCRDWPAAPGEVVRQGQRRPLPLIGARGSDITLAPDERLVYEAIVREGAKAGAARRFGDPPAD